MTKNTLHGDKQAGTWEIRDEFCYLIAMSTTSLSLKLLLKGIVFAVVLQSSTYPHEHEVL